MWRGLEWLPSWSGQEGRSSVLVLRWQKNGDGHLFWECTFLPILHVRELPEFFSLSRLWIGVIGPVVSYGQLPGRVLYGERDPWAASLGQLASWALCLSCG